MSHDISSFNENRFAVDDGIRDSGMRFAKNAVEGLARHIHLLGCLFVIKGLDICKAQGLQFIKPQRHLIKLGQRNTAWFEIGMCRIAADAPAFERSGHVLSPVMSICSLLLLRQ